MYPLSLSLYNKIKLKLLEIYREMRISNDMLLPVLSGKLNSSGQVILLVYCLWTVENMYTISFFLPVMNNVELKFKYLYCIRHSKRQAIFLVGFVHFLIKQQELGNRTHCNMAFQGNPVLISFAEIRGSVDSAKRILMNRRHSIHASGMENCRNENATRIRSFALFVHISKADARGSNNTYVREIFSFCLDLTPFHCFGIVLLRKLNCVRKGKSSCQNSFFRYE